MKAVPLIWPIISGSGPTSHAHASRLTNSPVVLSVLRPQPGKRQGVCEILQWNSSYRWLLLTKKLAIQVELKLHQRLAYVTNRSIRCSAFVCYVNCVERSTRCNRTAWLTSSCALSITKLWNNRWMITQIFQLYRPIITSLTDISFIHILHKTDVYTTV